MTWWYGNAARGGAVLSAWLLACAANPPPSHTASAPGAGTSSPRDSTPNTHPPQEIATASTVESAGPKQHPASAARVDEPATQPGDARTAAAEPVPERGPASASETQSVAFPAPYSPPHPQTAAAGDAEWLPLGDATLGELAASAPLLFKSVLHPHPKNSFVTLHVVALDLRRMRLGWIIGSKDQDNAKLAKTQTPGLIPADHQAETVAVFNGGFQARHGWWGMSSDGVTIVPQKPTGCTFALYSDGRVVIAAGSEFSAEDEQPKTSRQGPPCLLRNGEVHPDLSKGKVKAWAGQNADLKTRRRSAAGLSADGKTLYFAIGTETQALDLARGLAAVGAAHAVQLDINWAWARFLLAGRRDDKPRVTSSLLPQALFGKNEFFSRPSERDFFYVMRAP